ncbi:MULTISPECIES: TetR/AcrR family transcriptional regulator [Gordonia]|uniref:TetR/AcrR family transcriptional regulator n=1 Tax=Gordonia TaxID=2053 RepID=UPI0030FDF7F7
MARVNKRTEMLDAAVRVIAADGVRGLRVEKLAAQAGVSTAALYYHFTDRAGVLRAALEHVNQRAVDYTEAASDETDPRDRLESLLQLELADGTAQNSIAWGELRASGVFTPELREPLAETTAEWSTDVADVIATVRQLTAQDAVDAAERLTSLVEGLSMRIHSGSMSTERARTLLSGAIANELADR